MDFARFNRALEARKIQMLMATARKGDADALTSDEWAEVAKLDALHRKYYG